MPILLMGESGTGKELLARAVHCGSERTAGHGHGTATRHAAEGEAATRPDTVTIPQCGARPEDGRQRDVAAKALRNTNHAGRNALR